MYLFGDGRPHLRLHLQGCCCARRGLRSSAGPVAARDRLHRHAAPRKCRASGMRSWTGRRRLRTMSSRILTHRTALTPCGLSPSGPSCWCAPSLHNEPYGHTHSTCAVRGQGFLLALYVKGMCPWQERGCLRRFFQRGDAGAAVAPMETDAAVPSGTGAGAPTETDAGACRSGQLSRSNSRGSLPGLSRSNSRGSLTAVEVPPPPHKKVGGKAQARTDASARRSAPEEMTRLPNNKVGRKAESRTEDEDAFGC